MYVPATGTDQRLCVHYYSGEYTVIQPVGRQAQRHAASVVIRYRDADHEPKEQKVLQVCIDKY